MCSTKQSFVEIFTFTFTFSDYEVVVVTGDKVTAGTDANVFITVYGKTGATKKTPLKSAKKKQLFQQGDTDIFKFHDTCVGPMTKIKIEHDNTGVCPGWYLERVRTLYSVILE